jgi:hypothetical protein
VSFASLLKAKNEVIACSYHYSVVETYIQAEHVHAVSSCSVNDAFVIRDRIARSACGAFLHCLHLL